ncbi:MAG TPA: GAF domain-containing protein, partial [Candidatus Thermoplasmatota archaeon]|nr:GAF domain-containing protein [Candidatus Thermoplasmatota archaeon]
MRKGEALRWIEGLVSLTEETARLDDSEDVAERVCQACLKTLGASGAILGTVQDDGTFVTMASAGYDHDTRKMFERIPPPPPRTIVTDVGENGQPVFVSSREELQRRYPEVSTRGVVNHSWA